MLIAEGEAEYMKLMQSAYNTPEKAEFYNFMRSLDALKKSFNNKANSNNNNEKVIILDKDSMLVKMLYEN